MGPSRVSNSHVNIRKWAKVKFFRDFIDMLLIYKFDDDLMKIRSCYRPDNIFPHYMSLGD